MKKIRFYWLIAGLILAIVLVGAMLVGFIWWQIEGGQNKPPLAPLVPQQAAGGAALSLPSLPTTPQTMTDEMRQAAIEQAGEDARLAALASGQSEAQAQAAASQAQAAARAIFYPDAD